MTENNPPLIFSIFRCRRELNISGFVGDTDADKISIICNDVQKEEERQCSFSAMGNGPFDCESDCTVDNITCAINEHYNDTRSVIITMILK